MKKKKDWTRGMDTEGVKKSLARIRWLTYKIEKDVSVKSILTDMDYGDLADEVDKLYELANIGILAQENKERKEQYDFKS